MRAIIAGVCGYLAPSSKESHAVRYAINTPNFGDFSDVRLLSDLAREAEDAGWDGYFIWDHIGADWATPIADPWVALTAMALATKRITLGPLVTPLPRRRPWKLAREAATVDRLSEGRLVLGVGIGSDSGREFSCYGDLTDNKLHAAMLDEGLDVLMGLWSGAEFSYDGEQYHVERARFLPTPVQQPRIPIWVAGVWPRKAPFRRAARWDGVCPIRADEQAFTLQDVRDMLDYMGEYMGAFRKSDQPLEVVCAGYVGNLPQSEAAEKLAAYAEAGVTWWQEGFLPGDPAEAVRERIRQGPPA
jgi:alkanesulfonate monooxygenase SsuD/methylene tetrahydromethanopterin reductase-like flavin-dependent oxidoreductase (luciferase family)